MKDYLLVFLSVVLLAGGFVLQRVYQDCARAGNAAARFSISSGLISVVIMLAMNGFAPEFSWYSLINAFLKALVGFAYIVIGFDMMRRGKMVLYTLFLMSGGMLLPAIWGWRFLGDPVLPARLIGTAVILIAIVISNASKERTDTVTVIECIAVFILNGFVSVLSKLHQANAVYETVSTTGYALYSAVISIGMSALYYAITRQRTQGAEKASENRPSRRRWLLIGIVVAYSLIGTVSSLLQLEGAKTLPASVLYPMITGGSTVLTGLFSLLFFREKPSVKEWCGIGLCLVGTLLFL